MAGRKGHDFLSWNKLNLEGTYALIICPFFLQAQNDLLGRETDLLCQGITVTGPG